jgi:hypothetical protein
MSRMKRVTPLLAAALTLALSGCGLLDGLLGDVDADNVFGVRGAVVTLTPEAEVASAAAGRSAAASFSGELQGSFTIVGAPIGLPTGVVAPTAIRETIGIEASVSVAGDPLTLPDSFTVEGVQLSLSIAPQGGSVTFGASFVGDTTTVFAKGACAGASCSYAATSPTAALIQAEVTGVQARALYDIVTTGGTYLVTGSLTVALAAGLGAESIQMTIVTSDGVIAF